MENSGNYIQKNFQFITNKGNGDKMQISENSFVSFLIKNIFGINSIQTFCVI